MDFLPLARRQIIEFLWKRFKGQFDWALAIEEDLNDQTLGLTLDHLIFWELPGPASQPSPTETLFRILGFTKAGQLEQKGQSTDLIWMEEEGARESAAQEPLPQIVILQFKLREFTPATKTIISQLTRNHGRPSLALIEETVKRARGGDFTAVAHLVKLATEFLTSRDHTLPTKAEFESLRKESEPLAWMMVFGREVYQFGIGAQHLHPFPDLDSFTRYLTSDLGIEFTQRTRQSIREAKSAGIAQSTTQADPLVVELAGGKVTVANRSLEVVWRFPIAGQPELLWPSYFRGFVATPIPLISERHYRASA